MDGVFNRQQAPRTRCGWLWAAVMGGFLMSTGASLQGAEQVTSIEGITEYKLDNGLKVLLFPDDSKPTVTVNLTIFVGSRHEGYGEAGMAHLLEHMLFKGTPTHESIPKLLTGRGAQFNGTTWLDRTNYYETLPAVGDNLEFALRLESDRMMNSRVAAEDLASEMTVVRNEFERGENSPQSVLAQKMTSAAFQWHNYGQSTIGNRADIERVPIDRLKRFYVKYYQPDNAMLVVAGKLDLEPTLKLIDETFGKIPAPERELENTYTEEPAQDGERLVTLRRVGEVAVVGAIYHIPSGAHPDFAAVEILEGILTDTPSGRLYKALVETKRAARVSGAAFALHDPGMMRIMAEVSQGNEAATVLEGMLEAIEETASKGVTDEEVERIRQKFLKYRELGAANSRQLAIELSEWAAMGDWRLYFLHRDRLEAVTAEDVNKAAELYLQPSNRTVGMFIPSEKASRVSVPATPELAEMIGEYKGRELVAAGESFDLSPKNIEARTTRSKLQPGIQVALLPKKTRSEAVRLQLTLRYGTAESLKDHVKAAEFLPSMMLRGTKNLNRQEIQDQLDKARGRLNASGGPGSVTFSVETQRSQLPAVLELLRQVLREPAFPAEELAVMQRAQVSAYEQRLNDPQALTVLAVRKHITPWPKDDPRYMPSMPEEIERTKAVTVEELQKLYDEFLGASHGQLAIVGDFDPEEILPMMEKMLGDWVTKQPYERMETKAFADVPGGYEQIETPDKANAIYFSALSTAMSDADPDYAAMVIGNRILGGGSLSSRLADRVRQKEGLSYGVGSSFNASSLDERAVFYAYAIYNPSNLEKVKAAVSEEIAKILKDGVTDEELVAAKSGYLQTQEVSRSNDSQLAALLNSTAHANRSMAYYAELEERINSVTKADVQRVLQKYLKPKRLFTGVGGDFANAEKSAEDDATSENE